MIIDKITKSLLLLVVKQKQFRRWCWAVIFGCSLLVFSNCAYYNTFYNARKYYKDGVSRYPSSRSQAKTSFDKAIEKSALVISKYPTSQYIPEALFIIGMSYYYNGEYAKAISKFENLFLVFPAFKQINEANLYWAAALIETKEYNAAIERLQSLEEASKNKTVSRPTEELAMFKMAELYFFKKDYTEAARVLNNFITRYPKSERYYQALLMLGDVHRAEKDFFSAVMTYEKCLEKLNKYADAKTDTVQLSRQLNLYLAECFIESDRHDEGLKIIDAIVGADTSPTAKSRLSSKTYLDLGNLFMRMNEPDKARYYFKRVSAGPELTEAYYRLANSYESEAKFDTAKAYYDSVVKRQAQSEFSILAQSRLELLKLVVGDTPPILPVTAHQDTISIKPEDVKKAEEKQKLQEIEKTEDLINPENVQKSDSFESGDVIWQDTLFQNTAPSENGLIKSDTIVGSETVKIKDTTPRVDSAAIQFHLAEIYNLNLKQYARALSEYEKVYTKYPKSRFAPKALFAQTWLYQHVFDAAADTSGYHIKYRQLLNRIVTDYPKTEYAIQARKMLAGLVMQE